MNALNEPNDALKPEQHSATEKVNPFMNPGIGLMGFGLLLGWHFMVLYQPIPISDDGVASSYLISRQIGINASLCVFFLLGGFLMSKMPPKEQNTNHVPAISAIVAGVLGSAGLILLSPFGIPFTIASVILIGASEAILTLFWLRIYSETSRNLSGQVMGASAILACIVDYLGAHLAQDVVVIVMACLPLLSGIMLLMGTRGIPMRHNEPTGISIMDWESAKRPFLKATTQLMVMSLCFGVMQGCYTPDTTLLPTSDPISILGSGLAGLVIFLLYSRSAFLPNLNPAINASIILFLCGMLILPYGAGPFPQIAAFLIMTGFIFCFLLVIVFLVDLIRTFDLNATIILGINQALEYGMFVVGIVAGFVVWGSFSEAAITPFSIAISAMFVMAVVVLSFSIERAPWRADHYKPVKAMPKVIEERADAECAEDAPEVDISILVCEQYCLTPREIEVFTLLSKGRNAEYIQNALFISNHTVKTHIYNIYRKMDIHSLQELLDIIDDAKGESHT